MVLDEPTGTATGTTENRAMKGDMTPLRYGAVRVVSAEAAVAALKQACLPPHHVPNDHSVMSMPVSSLSSRPDTGHFNPSPMLTGLRK